MAKYDKETKFYWLQLKEDFFEEDSIEWLEEQENGHKYSLFYLKLCLKSLKTNGILIRKVGNMLVPYDNKKLAEMTKTPVDTVIVAMELLKGIGLVQILENGELYIAQLENMIGSQSKSALKKQQQRQLKQQLLLEGGQEGDICPPKIEIEIEQEEEIKKDIKVEKKKIYFDNENLNSIFEEFLQVRKKLKAVNSDRAIKTLINKLNKYTDDIKYQMIEKSIVNSWKDVYELKEEKNYQSNKGYTRQEVVPSWLNKEVTDEPITQEEQEELDDLLSEFKEPFEERKARLEERLKAKYGKKGNDE
jgi:predicted phage replisome organizer